MNNPSRLLRPIAVMVTLTVLATACSSAPAAAPAAAAAAAAPTSFTEAPMLADLAKAGKIPALADRLPKVPFVVGPGVLVAEKDLPNWAPGKYGGTLRTAHSVANWSPDVFVMDNESLLMSPGIGTDTVRGNVLKDFKVSDDGKTITFNMREGLKWSDGQPVTSEDVRFVYEDVMKNAKLSPNGVPARWRTGASPDGKEPTLKVLGDYSFEISYPEPYGGLLRQLTIESWVGYTEWMLPAHFMKQYHEKYADKDKLAKALADAKLKPDEWNTLFLQQRCQNWDITQPRCIGFPALWPWLLTKADQGTLTFERNPYYFKVDTKGQQLPYIDKIVSTQVQDVEAVNLKVLAGEVDFLRESTALVKVPLYKENEDKAGFKTTLLDMHVNSTGLILNETFTNTAQAADWAKYSRDIKFRQALSHAINRDEIIQTIYYGYASQPAQTVGDANATFDVDMANKLLDDVGLTKKDADGMRLASDGKPLTILLDHGAHAPDIAPVAEIVAEDLKKVGINVLVKKIDPNLWTTRRNSNDLMATVFWSHDQGWGGGVGMADGMEWPGESWAQYHNSQGKLGDKPPAWIDQGYKLLTDWWTAVPGSDAWKKVTDDSFAWQRDNLPLINIVEGVKYPMIASKKLGNVAQGGFAIASNFSGEQLFFNQ